MGTDKEETEHEVKQVIYVVPLDIVLGQIEIMKQAIINSAGKIEVSEKE